jgi:pimeloyl-ACP methyl ester carboxylesterase
LSEQESVSPSRPAGGSLRQAKRARRKRWLISVAILAILGGPVLTALQRFILFPRHLVPAPPTGATPEDVIRMDVVHEDGKSEGWLLLGRDASKSQPGPVVFFAHGNGELIDYWPGPMTAYRERGISVAMVEYRGYGRSDGSPSEETITADLVAFYDAVVAREDVDASRVVFHGRSLGGGAVCSLSRRRKPRALVLESTFRSVRSMAKRFLLPGFLVSDPFDNESLLASLDVPVLLFHGTKDQLIPYHHATTLRDTAKRATLVDFSCGHNDLPHDDPAYWQALDKHLAESGIL